MMTAAMMTAAAVVPGPVSPVAAVSLGTLLGVGATEVVAVLVAVGVALLARIAASHAASAGEPAELQRAAA